VTPSPDIRRRLAPSYTSAFRGPGVRSVVEDCLLVPVLEGTNVLMQVVAPPSPQGDVSAPHADQPNYRLMGFGAAAFVFSASLQLVEMLVSVVAPAPIFQAAGLGIGMALILYGANPKLGAGTRLEWTHLNFVGPTAAGAVIAWFAFTSLMEAHVVSDTMVLFNDIIGNQKVFADRSRVRLINVDSLKPKNVSSVLASVRNDVSRTGESEPDQALRAIMQRVIVNVRMPWNSVSPLVQDFLDGKDENSINSRWEQLVAASAQAAGPSPDKVELFVSRVRSQPFAIVEVTDPAGKASAHVIVPGDVPSLGGRTFSVPVIANPQRENDGVKEGIVLMPN
jgi:hypothetical protein